MRDHAPVYVTPAGLRRLDARIADAHEAYLAVCKTNEEAAGAGESSVWHDNFAHEENQRRLHQLAARDHERLAARAGLVPAASAALDRVRVGCSVRIRAIDETDDTVWFLAGHLVRLDTTRWTPKDLVAATTHSS